MQGNRQSRTITRLAAMLIPLLVVLPVKAEDNQVTFSTAYRMDNLNWNIAGNSAGTSPNILSELEWRDMQYLQFKAELSGIEEQIYYRGAADYGIGLDGENQDSDYSGDNRTSEFSRSVNGTSGSHVLDISGAVGHAYGFGEENNHQFIPLVGAAYNAQRMRITDGYQVIPASGAFAGLNSSYDAQWAGVWLGADVNFHLPESGMVYTRAEAHWARYLAQANWNLRTDLAHPVSFEHTAIGTGLVLELGWRKAPVDEGWSWGVGVSWQQWQTLPGNARTFSVNPAPPCNGNCYGDTRLNEVNWTSTQLNVNLSKDF